MSEEKQKPPTELENTVEPSQNKVKRLEKLCGVFRDTIERLEKENKELTEQCESLGTGGSPNGHVEDKVVKLQKTIEKLETENHDLREELEKLKGIDKAPEESIGAVQQLIQARHAAMKPKEEIGGGETWKKTSIPEIKSGTVSELVKKRDSAIIGQEDAKFSQNFIEKNIIEHEVETIVQPEPTPTESKNTSQSEEKTSTVIETEENKRICPKCNNQNLRLIREVIDKTKLISAYPRMYGKKFKCGECGTEWR